MRSRAVPRQDLTSGALGDPAAQLALVVLKLDFCVLERAATRATFNESAEMDGNQPPHRVREAAASTQELGSLTGGESCELEGLSSVDRHVDELRVVTEAEALLSSGAALLFTVPPSPSTVRPSGRSGRLQLRQANRRVQGLCRRKNRRDHDLSVLYLRSMPPIRDRSPPTKIPANTHK
jgi:hypothetical protein